MDSEDFWNLIDVLDELAKGHAEAQEALAEFIATYIEKEKVQNNAES